jgi:ATP-dependent helicase/nuclease subunit B
MTEPARPGSHVFALAPGVRFPEALVDGFLSRMQGRPPEAAAQAVIYLNTARMMRHVRAAFDRHGTRFLPRLRLVTDLAHDPAPGLMPPPPPLRRQLELITLVQALIARQPDLASDAAVAGLAESLNALLAEIQGEGVPPERFEAPGLAENHAEHWDRSLTFLRIVAGYAAADGAPDIDARQRLAVLRLIAGWRAAPPDHPVIVAGSTGSRGTTALLMQEVATLPMGFVVLPGFDFDMPTNAWNSLSSGPFPGEDHPQYRFLRLCQALGVTPDAVESWVKAAPPDPARNRFISLALRPAPMTDQWLEEGPGLGDLRDATRHVSLIEADTPSIEAKTIAIRLREAIESGLTAALVTPDRSLTRRVAAALTRWGITADDSAGEPLSQTVPGRFLRHIAGLFCQALTAETLLVLLKTPMTASTEADRGLHLRLTRELELRLRARGPAFPKPDDIRGWAKSDAGPERQAWARWLADCLARATVGGAMHISDWTETLFGLAEALATGPSGTVHQLWSGEAGAHALRAMTDLRREAGYGSMMSAPVFSDFLTSHLAAGTVRQTIASDLRVAIWGTLESRVQGADLVILAGLNEGIWPAAPPPDPWLSRQMRLKAGLLLPERRIGLSAHDFQQAAAASRVILSRALRDTDAETVPSRWLARMINLLNGLEATGGPDALMAMQVRGQKWIDLAQRMETPAEETSPARRPSPRPPISVRPRELAVTQIKTLIRDPYAVYARAILRLRRLEPLRPEADPRLRGKVLHSVLEAFVRNRTVIAQPDGGYSALMRLTEQALDKSVPWPVERRIWLARMTAFAGPFLAQEILRAEDGVPFLLEGQRSVAVGGSGVILTARPDRIDRRHDGSLHIFDYKTGPLPSKTDIKGADRQLVLEGAMAERGVFGDGAPASVAVLSYLHVARDAKEQALEIDDTTFDGAWRDLLALLAAYARPTTGYTARGKFLDTRTSGDYDHLSRFGEWHLHDDPAGENVG